jgi:hypothetical protein
MEVLWPALGICAIVAFFFFILAQHWQRLLRHHAWTIHRLTDRIRELEEMDDPGFRRRLNESAPVPLEQVYNLSFRLSEHFWTHTLPLSDDNERFIRAHGSFVGSIKLERWRSHTVATVTEVLPESKTAQWHTRSLDFYPDSANGSGALKLWELSLTRPNGTALQAPSLELTLRGNFVELSGHMITLGTGNGHGNGSNGHGSGNCDGSIPSQIEGESILFRVPLDSAKLAEFRSQDPSNGLETGNNHSDSPASISGETIGSNWQAFYSNHDENLGIEWQLWLRDLSKKAEWERWKIIETTPIPLVNEND